MLDPRTLTHVQLATIVTDVQKILWQESKPIPDFPREYGEYWNPAKEEDGDMLEQIADVLADRRLDATRFHARGPGHFGSAAQGP